MTYVITCDGCGEEFTPDPDDHRETSQSFAYLLWAHAAMTALNNQDHDVLFSIKWDHDDGPPSQ